MDLDSSYTKPLINDWINHLQQIMKDDNKISLALQFKAIQDSSIEVAFKIAEYLQVTPHIKYMAIFLYDEFMYKYFQKICTTEIANGLREEQLDKIYNNIANKAKLYLLSCFQLSCKMDSPCIRIEISEIIKILQVIDSKTTYTHNMVTSSEYEVFRTVGFKMPLNTPLTCVEILLAAINCKDQIDYELALLLLDIAFLQHEKLYIQFQQEVSERVEYVKCKKSTFLKSNILFLSAAIVACTSLFCNPDRWVSIVEVLAEKSLSETIDIMTMANILYEMATYN